MKVASRTETRHFRPHQYLAHASEVQDAIYRIDEGWACRFRLLPDGRRQITALFVPGDYCEPQWALGEPAAQSITALTNVRARPIPCRGYDLLEGQRTDLSIHLIRSMIASINRQSDWIVSLGRKSAIERLSELFCEMFDRMRRAGLAYGDQCALPLTQVDLADVTGLTAVHVNRVLQELRDRGLIELHSKWLRIPDLDALRELAVLPFVPTGEPRRESNLAVNTAHAEFVHTA